MAGKIVPKSLLVKSHQKEKMAQEIRSGLKMKIALNVSDFYLIVRLHTAVSNMYLVKLFSYFEDNHFVYIILELCRKRYGGYCGALSSSIFTSA